MREATVERETSETYVRVSLRLDGSGKVSAETGLGFFDHMLTTLMYYAGFDGTVEGKEKVWVGGHHVIEDVGLALGEAVRRALGSSGFARFGEAVTPMDEALVLAAVDISGRPRYYGNLPQGSVAGIPVEDLSHFIESLAATLGASVHVLVLREGNTHHVVEAAFKSLGRALGAAVSQFEGVRSLKGTLLG
ncbi:MAG: imidazoleglycerol-phosphate dehydratase [Aeropyrum sp.]|nr:imidazoleglycerol-phosphate dehydratase [Aeropyrum sp.]